MSIPTRSGTSTRWRRAGWITLAALAGSYLFVRSKARQAELANPPGGRFIEVDGVKLHYVERGEGPDLVLLHGNATMGSDFEFSGLLEAAAQRHRVIVFDRPGFGYSERPRRRLWTPLAQARLLHEALHRLGVERPVVLGHSWGSMVALAMGLEFPADVRALVLLSGYYYPSLRLDAPLSALQAIPILGDLLRRTISPLLGRLNWPLAFGRAFSPGKIPQQFRRLSPWLALRPSQLRASAAEAGLMIPAALGLQKRYAELSMPVVIMAGEDDKVAHAWYHALRLHRALADSDLHLLPGVGHMMHYRAVDAIMDAIARLDSMPAHGSRSPAAVLH